MPEVKIEARVCKQCGDLMFVTPDDRRFNTVPTYVLMSKSDDVFTAEKVWVEHACDDGLAADELVNALDGLLKPGTADVQCPERESGGIRCERSLLVMLAITLVPRR